MTEVLKKIQELHDLLQDKLRVADKRTEHLSKMKADVEEAERKQKAAWTQISARERILKKYEDFDGEKEKLRDSIRRNMELKKENQDILNDLDKKQKDIEGKEKELDESIALFKRKNTRMDAFEKELETERELMREKILEEIKGKL